MHCLFGITNVHLFRYLTLCSIIQLIWATYTWLPVMPWYRFGCNLNLWSVMTSKALVSGVPLMSSYSSLRHFSHPPLLLWSFSLWSALIWSHKCCDCNYREVVPFSFLLKHICYSQPITMHCSLLVQRGCRYPVTKRWRINYCNWECCHYDAWQMQNTVSAVSPTLPPERGGLPTGIC